VATSPTTTTFLAALCKERWGNFLNRIEPKTMRTLSTREPQTHLAPPHTRNACATTTTGTIQWLPLRERALLLAAVLPRGFVSGKPAERLCHMEVIYYGKDCGGHWHCDPPKEGDEIVILTLHGSATFELREGLETVEAIQTAPGTIVRLAGAARHECEHCAGVAEGSVRVGLQLGFSGLLY